MTTFEDRVDAFEAKEIEEGLKSAKALIQTFLQTLKTYRLYESYHPVLRKYLDRLKKDFDRYFDEYDTFSLQVTEHQLFYRGHAVYESEDVKESIAFLFFKDGIREIQFFRGLEFGEVVSFLEIMRKADFINRLEDDLVTLIWEKDFSHIAITVVDDFLEEGATFVPATQQDLYKGMEYKGFEEGLLDGKMKEKEVDEDHILEAEGIRQAINSSPGQSLVQACQLDAGEIAKINQEIQRDGQPDYIFVLVDNLIEILLHLGEDVDAYENMISYFERTILSLLEQKEIKKALMILKNLNDTMESIVLKDKQIFAIRRIFDTMSGPQPIDILGRAMKGDGEVDSESILKYLSLVTKQAINPLCHLLGQLESAKWRRVICDLLAELSKEDIQPLTKFLSGSNSFLICHLLYVLGKIGHPSTLKYLKSLVVHEVPRVREETLQLLSKFGERGKDLIQKFLGDSSAEIRAKASVILARTAKGEAVKPLMEVILSEEFYKRDYEEKASFFRALGETGSREAIPELTKIAKKRRWLQKAKWDEMRVCANNALKMIETAGKANLQKSRGLLDKIERL